MCSVSRNKQLGTKMKKEIESLKSGETFIIKHSNCDSCGKAEIWKINDIYVVFEIPIYGGKPMFMATCHLDNIDRMIEHINNWT